MHWIDYLIVAVPLLTVVYIGYRSRKYVGNVTDFLTAGRVAGRYVIAVAGGEAAMGLISVVAMMEMYCHTGFAVPFWGRLAGIAAFFYIITGYCSYRFRETRAMTLGQFFGKRYSQKFRFWAAILQSTSGILNYALFPAVGARFFVYFLDLPIQVTCLGMHFPTFGLLMFVFLSIALMQALWGGQVTLMITDCIQGILHYPMYMIIVFFIFWKFSWSQEMLPALLDRPEGKSFLNPYDIRELRDFNLFYVMSGIFMGIFMRMTWSGAQGYAGAAISAHEQKMGGILSYWRSGFAVMMYIMLAVAAITYFNHGNYRAEANRVNRFLSIKTVEDVAADNPELRDRMVRAVDVAAAKSVSDPAGGPNYHELVQQSLREQDKAKAQTFEAIYRQMQVTVAVRDMLPVGLTGIFCAMMVFMLLGTDSTYMHSWGSILAQDLILPWRKKPFTPKQQLLVLRISISLVAVFAFFFSLYYAQIDYILMFFAITGAIFATGAGPCIVSGFIRAGAIPPGHFAHCSRAVCFRSAESFASRPGRPGFIRSSRHPDGCRQLLRRLKASEGLLPLI